MSINRAFYNRAISSRITSPAQVMNMIHKILIVISVYLIVGQLFQYVYANSQTIETNTIQSQTTKSNAILDQADPYQSQHGAVWLLQDTGLYSEAINTATDVDYTVTGGFARAKVKQQFTNNSGLWTEGIFVFPLPEKAAVEKFRMHIGDRIIEGQIQPRQKARKNYQQARAAGKKTSLLEQQRPNVFTTSLANIAPGEQITIEFDYLQVLDYTDGYYHIRFPMVVGPRYQAKPTAGDTPSNDTSVYTETDTRSSNKNPIRIHVLLDAGISLAELESLYHRIDIIQTEETRYSISTIGNNIISDRDFELRWKPVLSDQPQLAAFNDQTESDHYTLVTLMPPKLDTLQQKIQERDLIFVLDISGSMAGTSIEQAKATLVTAIKRLNPFDRFNLIWFNNDSKKLFRNAVFATDKNIQYAIQTIDELQANGGTEMLPALQQALVKQPPYSRFRQLVFLTDGNISNETELFTYIKEQLGNNRLFTIGIGSAPNAYFMRKAAYTGRGTFTYISDVNEVKEKTDKLLSKLEHPALKNIEISIKSDGGSTDNTSSLEIFPERIPDLYTGETATILIKSSNSPDSITVSGDYDNSEWQKEIRTSDQQDLISSNIIPIAWAREKIAALMSSLHDTRLQNTPDTSKRESLIKQVTDTAVKYHLVSRYTSLVAVDVTPSNDGGMLLQHRLKNNQPHGWGTTNTSSTIMLAKTATDSRLYLVLGLLLVLVSIFISNFYHPAGITH